MSAPGSVHVELLLGELKQVLKLEPNNVPALCRIGAKLAQLGREQDMRKCYRAAVDAMRRAARQGEAQAALFSEKLIYESLVKLEENEAHYQRCFAEWHDDFAQLGMRYRQEPDASRCDARRIAFFLHAGYLIGHTEVLFKIIQSLRAQSEGSLQLRIYVLIDFNAAFVERARSLGVEVVLIETRLSGGRAAPLLERFLWLRNHLREEGFGVCVWVSAPLWAAFAMSLRLAPVQIFWAMRFHAVGGPDIDGYITWGAPSEKTRRYGDQEWQVVPMPLALDGRAPGEAQAQIEQLRKRFPEALLLGTLAREEKISSPPFLQAVADILAAHPQAGFLWTGSKEHPGITSFFRAAGVASRCHFVGWVDTKLYAAALDIFLETFPAGSGVTSLQTLAAQVPLLSYLHPETIFGTYYWPELPAGNTRDGAQQRRLDAPDQYPILCARDTAEYVALAGRLITDAAWRAEIGARGRAFFEDELRSNEEYARRFFETVSRIVAAKLACPAPPGS